MTKPYSPDDLSNQLDQDFTWRLKEFSDLKTAIQRADEVARPALLRAFIALMYAHWEGYVKLCASKYFQHIALRRKRFSELESQLYVNYFLPRLDAFFRSRGSVAEKCQFLADVLSSADKRFSYINPALVDTHSNLNTDVLSDLCKICGISFAPFEDARPFIDILMLKRRNEIAHGAEVYVGADEIDDLTDRAIGLMRAFRNLLENKVYQRLYLA
jgi:hypothetical protein